MQAPKAPSVVVDTARFEFLTPSLVRMEYSPSGKFVDAPSAVVSGGTGRPSGRVDAKGRLAQSTTSAMRLRYRHGSGPFTAANLTISWNDQAGAAHAMASR
jgi:hypothetical protein